MKKEFLVGVKDFKKISGYPNAWLSEDYRTLLKELDFDEAEEIAEDELADFLILALQELEIEEAAAVVLNYKLGHRLNKGQIQNLTEEMQDEPLWEEYPDISFHKDLFICGILLNQAFPRDFQRPQAAKVILNVQGKDPSSYEDLLQPDVAFVVRLLADGMTDSSVLRRLFADKLAARTFPEAQHILWKMELSENNQAGSSAELVIYSSLYWLKLLDDVSQYVSYAHKDELQTV